MTPAVLAMLGDWPLPDSLIDVPVIPSTVATPTLEPFMGRLTLFVPFDQVENVMFTLAGRRAIRSARDEAAAQGAPR